MFEGRFRRWGRGAGWEWRSRLRAREGLPHLRPRPGARHSRVCFDSAVLVLPWLVAFRSHLDCALGGCEGPEPPKEGAAAEEGPQVEEVPEENEEGLVDGAVDAALVALPAPPNPPPATRCTSSQIPPGAEEG